MNKPRILFINRSYWPDTEATGQLLTSLCEGLVDEFEVEVVAGRPNHVQDRQQAATVGYIRRNGVTIHRVLHTRLPKNSFIGRLLNLTTFTAAAFLAMLWRSPKPNVVVTETDPFFLPLLGRFVKWRYNVPFVAYLQDIYPDIAIALGKAPDGVLTRCLRSMLVSSCNQADRVVVLSEDMRQRCIANGIHDSRIEIIPNWADCDKIRSIKEGNLFRKQHQLDGKFLVMYSGNLGLAHLLDPILDAAAELKENRDVVFLFIGEGAQKARLQQVAKEQGLKNVRFLPYQPREFLEHSLSAADIQIVSMVPEAKGCVVPSKLYGILASGTAVLSLGPTDSDVSRLVASEDVGVVCDPFPAETLTARLTEAIRDMAANPLQVREQGLRGRLLCENEFDRPQQVEKYSRLLNQVVRPQVVPRLGPTASSGPPRKPQAVAATTEATTSI